MRAHGRGYPRLLLVAIALVAAALSGLILARTLARDSEVDLRVLPASSPTFTTAPTPARSSATMAPTVTPSFRMAPAATAPYTRSAVPSAPPPVISVEPEVDAPPVLSEPSIDAPWFESALPPAPSYFGTLPPGASLPSSAYCAGAIRAASREPRPENHAGNSTPGGQRVQRMSGPNEEGQRVIPGRIDGDFTGSTDEIIQWAACKWGFDEDLVRAVAQAESSWRQTKVGDNGESFGILQVKCTVHTTACPAAQYSTAFNVDYALAWRRSCFEGYFREWVPQEARGDEWGCVGLWYSGRWQEGNEEYVEEVREHLSQKAWLRPDF